MITKQLTDWECLAITVALRQLREAWEKDPTVDDTAKRALDELECKASLAFAVGGVIFVTPPPSTENGGISPTCRR